MWSRFAIAGLLAVAASMVLALPITQPNTSPTTLARLPSTPVAPPEAAAQSTVAASYEIEVLAGVGASGGPTDLSETTGWHPDKDTDYLAIDIAASADTEVRAPFREVRTPPPDLYYYAEVVEAVTGGPNVCSMVEVEVYEAALSPAGIPASISELGRVRYIHVAPDVEVGDTIPLASGERAKPVGKMVAAEAAGCPFSGPHLHQSANVNNDATSMWRNVDVSGRYEDDGLGFDDYPPVAVTDPAEFCSDTWIFKVYPPLPTGKTKAEWAPRATPFAKCAAPDNAPVSLTATPSGGKLTLAWTGPTLVAGEDDPIDGYRLRWRQTAPSNTAWSEWGNTDSASRHSLTGLTNGNTYAVQVRAQNASGVGPPATTSATPASTPTPTPPPTEPPTQPPPPATYQVTVQTAGDGTGTVTPSSGRYRGSQTFTASATGGSTFAGWSGCDSVSGSACSVNVTGPVTITATFDPPTYQVTVLKAGAGTGTVTPGSGRYRGSKTFTASATGGSTFAGWSGCDSVSGSACSVNVTGPVTITATFDPPTYQVTVLKAGAGTGTVTPGSGRYRGSKTFTARAASGSTFAGWSGCDSVSGSVCTVNVTAAVTITATFERKTHTLRTSVSVCCGSIDVSPSGPYYHGDNTPVTLTARPQGLVFSFDSWGGDCEGETSATCDLTMNDDMDVTVAFSHSCDGNTGIGCGRQEDENGDGEGSPPP